MLGVSFSFTAHHPDRHRSFSFPASHLLSTSHPNHFISGDGLRRLVVSWNIKTGALAANASFHSVQSIAHVLNPHWIMLFNHFVYTNGIPRWHEAYHFMQRRNFKPLTATEEYLDAFVRDPIAPPKELYSFHFRPGYVRARPSYQLATSKTRRRCQLRDAAEGYGLEVTKEGWVYIDRPLLFLIQMAEQ